jgi:CrcB protein
MDHGKARLMGSEMDPGVSKPIMGGRTLLLAEHPGMQTLVLVGAGGAIGALARFGLSLFVAKRVGTTFPAGTLVVNVIGCFLLGILMAVVIERELFDPRLRLFVGVGLLGSFTTFSTFGAETIELLREGQVPAALGNVALNVVVGLLAVWMGHILVRLVLE